MDDPQAIPEVTYDELRELSYSGAQVLHEDSIFPVREKNIPVNIRNTNDPEAPGTMIQGVLLRGTLTPTGSSPASQAKRTFPSSPDQAGMSNQVGVLRRVLSVLERHNISVDYVPNGIDNVSVVLPTAAVEKELYTIMAEIKRKPSRTRWTSTTNCRGRRRRPEDGLPSRHFRPDLQGAGRKRDQHPYDQPGP